MHPTPHDALFKAAFSDLALATEALSSILGPSLTTLLDLSNLALMPGSFVDKALQGRHADLLFSTTLTGRPALVYVLYEHQSSDDPWMALRVSTYMTRICPGAGGQQDHRRHRHRSGTRGGETDADARRHVGTPG